MNFSARLKELRNSHSLSQKKLAEELKYSQSIISDWEKGTKEPTAQAIIALAKYFRISTDDLLGISNDNIEQEDSDKLDEILLLQAYHTMSAGKKQALFSMLDIQSAQQKQHNNKG